MIRPSKPVVHDCSGFKKNTGQSKKVYSQKLLFHKELEEAGIHVCGGKASSGMLQKNVHVSKVQ